MSGKFSHHLVAIVFALAVSTVFSPTIASAQSIWDLFEDGPAGRTEVAFDPKYTPKQIIVSFGDRRLYFVREKGKAVSYPIAIPRPKSRWAGIERVSMKRVNPPWTPTPSMRLENPQLPSFVPGGHPRNPLGVRALYLGNTAYRIHGTDAPSTIGSNVSKGCIRMFNEHIIELYNQIPVGTKVTVTWASFGAEPIDNEMQSTASSQQSIAAPSR